MNGVDQPANAFLNGFYPLDGIVIYRKRCTFEEMLVRQANIFDAAAVQRLLIQLGYPGLDEAGVAQKLGDYTSPAYHLLVSETNGLVTGFIALHTFDIFHSPGKIGRITAFCVDEHVRGTGVGTRLMEAAEAWFISQGCTKLEVTSNARRTATHAFYLNKGWTEDSRRFVKYLTE